MHALGKILPWMLIVAAPMGMLYPLWAHPLSASEDDLVSFYPQRKMVAAELRQGRWPIRNPLEATGSPMLADPQAAVMFPLTWLFVVMEAKLAYSLSIFLGFAVAGCGAYLYLRQLGLVRPAATFGGIAFMFCGFMVGHRVHLGMIQTAAFLPWGLWCIEGLRDRPARAFAWLVPIGYLAITAGHWPILTYMGLLWVVYLLCRARPLLRSVGIAAAALVLASALAGPQIQATVQLLANASRRSIGFAEASENSFYPVAAVLALYPMLLGSRTPNFFPQRWWGPWHLCEMLGYVGLATLALAGASVWRLYRRGRLSRGGPQAQQAQVGTMHQHAEKDPAGLAAADLSRLVKLWTWFAAAAGVWMLGYYLPSYRLIHLVPVLNVVRCPARMVMVVDVALATLAAISIHVLIVGPAKYGPRAVALVRTVRRSAAIVLPVVVLAVLGALAGGARLLMRFYPGEIPPFEGTVADAVVATRLGNPAVWVPLALLTATVLAIRLWLVRPDKRAPVLILLLLADLFFLTRFVDVPPADAVIADPEAPPAAQWLAEHAPKDKAYRIYSLARNYHDRPAELLLPKTGQALGFATLGSYGPWHSHAHAHLLGFGPHGHNSNWPWLIRRNVLLSLYNVRYILAAGARFRQVIESVRIVETPPGPDGPTLLASPWQLKRATLRDGTFRLGTGLRFTLSYASQPVPLEAGQIYRISMDVRSPPGRMANLLRAEICKYHPGGRRFEDACLEVHTEQAGEDWRHFEHTFQAPQAFAEETVFVLSTVSERIVEIRNVELRASHWDVPVNLGGRLEPGEKVYGEPVLVPAVDRRQPEVAIYQNRLCQPAMDRDRPRATPQELEALKWRQDWPEAIPPAPDIALKASSNPSLLLWACAVPGGLIYLGLAAAGLTASRWGRKPA